jgi:hypothetical protein
MKWFDYDNENDDYTTITKTTHSTRSKTLRSGTLLDIAGQNHCAGWQRPLFFEIGKLVR